MSSLELMTVTDTWRSITPADIPAMQEILLDWEHGYRAMNPRVIENDCYRWIEHMRTHTVESPMTPDTNYVQFLIAYRGGNPFGCIRYTAWGANHKLANGESSITLNVIAFAPTFRNQGFFGPVLNDLVSACFTHSDPDATYSISANAQAIARLNSMNDYDDRRPVESFQENAIRERIRLTRANWEARIAARPELAVQTSFVLSD